MVELDDFIAEALTSMVQGIKKGQDLDVGNHIAPMIQGKDRNSHGNFYLKGSNHTKQATIVKFDVQVATEATKSGEGGAKAKFRLLVINAQIGMEGNLTHKASNLHRLQFAIPIEIPNRLNTDSTHMEIGG